MSTHLKPQAGFGGSEGDVSDFGFSWRRLQKLAAIGVLVSFVAPMLIDLSLEPFLLSMAAPFAVGLLLAVRWPRVAAIWLGVVSLAVLLFSVPFLGEVLIHPESAVDFIPLSLFALGTVVGAGAAIPAFREVERASQSLRPRRIAAVAAGLLVAASTWSVVAFLGVEEGTPQPGDILMTVEDFAFAPVDVTTESGTVSLAVTNHDNTRHTFTITELGVDLSLTPGTTQRITFTAEPGTYAFFCTPHPDMQGRLVAG